METKAAFIKVLKVLTKYIFLAGLNVFLSASSLYGIRPFGAGFFVAISLIGVPIFFTAPVFILSEALISPDVNTALYSCICAAVVFVGTLFYKKAGRFKSYLMPLIMLLSQGGIIFLAADSTLGTINAIISVLASTVFMYAAHSALKPIIAERLKYKLLETEVIALCIVTTAAALGISSFKFFDFPLIAFFCALSVLLAARLKGIAAAIITAFCFGVGGSLTSYNPILISLFVFVAVIAGIFASAPRIISAMSALVGYVIFAFYFNVDYSAALFWLAALGAAGLIFVFIPKKVLSYARSFLVQTHERAAVRYMINRSRAQTGTRLLTSADIFNTMSAVLRGERASTKKQGSKLMAKCCAFCDGLPDCDKAGFIEALDDFAESAAAKGRAGVSEIPASVAASCIHLARLVSAASEIGEKTKNIRLKNDCENSAKNIVATQLKGISMVLNSMAAKEGEPKLYDREREKLIVEELCYNSIVCAECLIAGEEITLVVRTECLEREVIQKIVSKIMRNPYAVSGVDDTALSGFCAVSMSVRPKYDMVFGVASCPKTQGALSGDTHSFIKLDNSRFMIALCDGMGSGEQAEKISETAISLIESFYRAGFSSQMVLQSVNRFLSLTNSESFSALDVCVVDLNNASADIIKLGCPPTYIKQKEAVKKIESQSLPLGAVEDISPSFVKINLAVEDTLFLASDGVADCFDGDKLAAAILNLPSLNTQSAAEGVLKISLANNGGVPKDDSTVIAARLIVRA